MRREILLPKLGLTMTEGVLLEWMVNVGETFKKDQSLFVVETDKAANEISAEDDGVLLEITALEGENLPCGSVIGYWDDGKEEGEDTSVKIEKSVENKLCTVEVQNIVIDKKNINGDQKRIISTPLARRIALQKNIDINQVVGTGPNGRIKAKDILKYSGMKIEAEKRQSHDSGYLQQKEISEVHEKQVATSNGQLRNPTNLEKTIAQRLVASKQQIPHFYLSTEVEMSEVIKLRMNLNNAQQHKKFTVNHFILSAVGRALEKMPEVNCIWSDEGILSLPSSDVGMAINSKKGLLVAVLRDIGKKSLSQICTSASTVIELAQNGRLSQEQMSGGAITVSNAGMFDVTYMTSIINPGQSMILGVGSIRETFRPNTNGAPILKKEMGIVLSADHRILDGATALKFLKLITQILENPVELLIDLEQTYD